MGLYGCSSDEANSTPPVEVVTVQDIKDHAQDYDVYYLHTLLRYLAEQHETITDEQLAANLEIANSYYKKIGADVDAELKEAMVKAQVYEELAFLRILGKTYEQVEREVKNDTDIFEVYQFVFLGGADVSETAQQLSDALQGTVSTEQVQALYTEYSERADIEVTAMTYTTETLPSIFSKVNTLNAGDTYRIGDETYAGVVHVHNRQKATIEGLISTYKQYVTTSYPDTMDLIHEYLNSLPTKYQLGDGVAELIYQQIEGLE